MRMRCNRGLTLVELVVVIAVIGLLAGTGIVFIDPVTHFKRSRDAQRKADLIKMQTALELYRSNNGLYPATADLSLNPASPPTTPTDNELRCGVSFTGGSGSITYLQRIPCDPTDSSPLKYKYEGGVGGVTYKLVACLENDDDKDSDEARGLGNNNTYCTSSYKSYTVNSP